MVCAGFLPSKTNYYDNNCKLVKEICNSKVNLIRISPDERIVCLGGFGNASGDIEIYRLSDYKLIGKTKYHGCIALNWSPDSKYLLGAVLSPRIKVDNEYKILSYNGDILLSESFNREVYECDWLEYKSKILYKNI
jgi:translation initiation factor 2A